MNADKARLAAAGLVVVALLLVGFQLVRGCHRRARAHKALLRPFWCETCQKEFEAPARSPTAVCPECKTVSHLVRHYYVCAECGDRFLAYDADLVEGLAYLPGETEPVSVYHLPDKFPCPKCQSTETALETYKRR